MTEILNIGDKPIFDDRIVKIETHTYNPYANTTFGHSDEVRIPIQQQDLYTLPCESFLYVEGKLTIKKPAANKRVVLENNCVAFMFDEIRYELNGVDIDRSRNVGITSTLKNYVSLTTTMNEMLKNAGWDIANFSNGEKGHFNFCVPLRMLLGFCEDYRRVVINARHELILIRSRNDNNDKFGFCGSFVVIDCSRQSESVKTATVDVRLEFDCMEDIPANTTAYCLIIHDRVVEYAR
ncbi:hypothetical protein X777_04305 [Ooceraea biroi]|uniref:Double jelly roll-like domain-containing protein n=1 Tax=Ooceraea biroi TaxID=2015173 RepID=A0A026WI76_OOCBI|nr:hypothetical protein X777_04305 [Ooceraea biroi]